MHAHISVESADCDGRYSRTNVLLPDEDQDEFGFRTEIIGNVLNFLEEHTSFTANGNGFTTSHPTDEGYVSTEIRFCDEDDADEKATFRDHSAEAAGY